MKVPRMFSYTCDMLKLCMKVPRVLGFVAYINPTKYEKEKIGKIRIIVLQQFNSYE
jgi:hypothetical protein